MIDLLMASQTALQNRDKRKYVPRQRNPLNTSGPFYTEANVCTACLLPEGEAPELLGFEEDLENPKFGCFFKKQPEVPEELEHTFMAMAVSCVDGLRYGGTDPAILRRLRELGMERQCDFPLPVSQDVTERVTL